MKLLFCSNLQNKVDKDFIKLFSKIIKIGYIPSQYIDGNIYFEKVKNYYLDNYSIQDVVCLDIDKDISLDFVSQLDSCNILILSGGNT